MSERPESLEEQAAQEGYVPEYEPDEDDWDLGPEIDDRGRMSDYDYDISDPYDIEYDVP